MVQDKKRRREEYARKQEAAQEAAQAAQEAAQAAQEAAQEAAAKQKKIDSKAIKRHVPRLIKLAEEAKLPLDDNSCTSDYFEANKSHARKLLAWGSLRGNAMKLGELRELLHAVGLLEKAHTSIPTKDPPSPEQQKIPAAAATDKQHIRSPEKTPAAAKATPSSEQQKIPAAAAKQQQFSSPEKTPVAAKLGQIRARAATNKQHVSSPEKTPAAATLPSTVAPTPTAVKGPPLPSTSAPTPTVAKDASGSRSAFDLLAHEDLDALDEDELAILSNNLQSYDEKTEEDYALEQEELRKYEAELKGRQEESKKRDEESKIRDEESKMRDEIGEELCDISSRRLSRIDQRRQTRDTKLLLQTKILTVSAKKKKQTRQQTPQRFADLQRQGHGQTNLFDDEAFHGRSDLAHGGRPALKETSPNKHTTGRDHGGSPLPYASTQNQSPPCRQRPKKENEVEPDKPTEYNNDDDKPSQYDNAKVKDDDSSSVPKAAVSPKPNRVRFDFENVEVRFFEKTDENQEKCLVSYKAQKAVKNRWMSKSERKFIREFSVEEVNKLKEQAAARQVLHVAHDKELLDKLDQGALVAAYEKGYTARLSDDEKNDRKALVKKVRMKLFREREGIKVSNKKKELMSESE
jgi:hypothetical protein